MSWRDEQNRKSQEFYARMAQIDQSCADTLGISVEQLDNVDWETEILQVKLQDAIDAAVSEQARNRKG